MNRGKSVTLTRERLELTVTRWDDGWLSIQLTELNRDRSLEMEMRFDASKKIDDLASLFDDRFEDWADWAEEETT